MFASLGFLVVYNVLLSRDAELDGFFFVYSPAVGTCAAIGILQAVVAELADLVAAWTGLEVLVGEVKLFDAKGTERLD